jgi:uncharacterized protein
MGQAPRSTWTRERWAVRLATGEQLRGAISFTERPGTDAIVYVHGFGSHRQGEKSLALEDACRQRGLTFAAFDFRSHGESDGTMPDLTGSRLQEDLDAVRHYLAGRGVQRLRLVGSSMGGWAAAWFACRASEVTHCFLIAPAFRFLQMRWLLRTDAERNTWERAGKLAFQSPWFQCELGIELVRERGDFEPDILARRWQKPLWIVHGMEDEIVPYEHTLDWVRNVPAGPVHLQLVRNGDHRLSIYSRSLAEDACRFFGFDT